MLTQEERVKIRLFLGFPDVYQDNDPRLESAMDVMGDRPETLTRVKSILAEIEAILPLLAGSAASGSITTGGLKKVDEIEFYPVGSESSTSSAQTEVKKLGRMWVNQLSIMMGVPIVNDIFSGKGYSGDWWAGWGFQYGGSGGMIPLG